MSEETTHLCGKGVVRPGGMMATSVDSSLEIEDYQRPRSHFPTLSGHGIARSFDSGQEGATELEEMSILTQ